MTSSDSLASSDKDLVDWAVELSMLSTQQGNALRKKAADQSQPIELVAITGNVLTAQDIDIIETIRRPFDRVPGYEILGLLGRGGMGVVYRAKQIALNREVALKTIPTADRNDSSISRFEQEAQLAARLHHPNIISIHDFGRGEDRIFTAMELVSGRDGDEYIAENHPVAESVVWGIIKQAAAGLAHAASQGVIHRDIKPANLLLFAAPDGYDWPADLPMVKIADFGLASLTGETQRATRLTTKGTTIGSPHYMAPEQLQASAVDHRADIYALGATAFHFLAGRPPFQSLSLSQIVAQKFGPPPDVGDLGEISDESTSLVQRMMDPAIDSRIQNYEDLLAELRELSPAAQNTIAIGAATRNLSTSSAPQSTVSPTVELKTPTTSTQNELAVAEPPTIKKSRWVISLTIAALCVVAAIVGVVVWRTQSNRRTKFEKPEFAAGQFAASLFDGRGLDGWTTKTGSWDVEPNVDGANVLVGIDGVIKRNILLGKRRNSPPLRFFRLTFSTMLVDADAAELRFGIERSKSEPGYIVKVTDDQVALLFGDDKNREEIFSKSFESAKSRLVQLERGKRRWWVSIDGEEFASAPVRKTQQLPQVRFAAMKGKARFSDVYVFELQME